MRSILKLPHLPDVHLPPCPEPFPFAACASVEVSPHVHFPPTPTLTSTYITHSASVYDRTPAEVLPNTCALPGRHEREFVDTTLARPRRRRWARDEDPGSYFYPRGAESSESDESDVVRTPPEPMMQPPMAVRFGRRHVERSPYMCQDDESALLFLPSTPLMSKGRSRSQCRTRVRELREESADGRIQRCGGDFVVPTLDFDGCLGGF